MQYVGVVDLIAPDLGVVWIREGDLGERRLLEVGEYTLYRCTSSPQR
ncbi:hypothetical protein ACH9DO_06825 [Kocuria sp. M1N1S27]